MGGSTLGDDRRRRSEMSITPTSQHRRIGVPSIALASVCAFLWGAGAQAATVPVSPLPASDYSTQSACATPAPGHEACMAELLVPETPAARARTHPLGMTLAAPIKTADAAEGSDGLRPQDLRNAYFPGEAPDAPDSEPQTIAIVDAYNDPEAEADLRIYDEEFHLPECTTGNGCFAQVNQNGETGNPPFPATVSAKQEEEALCESTTAEPAVKKAACRTIEEADAWSSETALDIEMAHAVCQNCHILLVEAAESEESNLEVAEDTAVRLGANEVSNSWVGNEPLIDSEAFNHPGVVITAASGDRGYLNWGRGATEEELYGTRAGVNYPASSPHVIAVGGTSLEMKGITGAWSEWSKETAWREGGSGCSLNFNAQPWQSEVSDWSSVGCEGRRAVADVAADANPYTGVALYDSVPYIPLGGGLKSAKVLGWRRWGGTSLATPIIAAMFALAGGSHGVAYPAQTLYSHLGSSSLHDITEDGNGRCEGDYGTGCTGSMNPLSLTDCGQGVLICNAGPGYDGPTGVGTPNGIAAFKPSILPPAKPKAPETRSATNITSESVTLNGKLGAESVKTSWYFEYAAGTSCTGAGAKMTPEQEDTMLGEPDEVSALIINLQPGTEYEVCLVATNRIGTTSGSESGFVTKEIPPTVDSVSAQSTSTEATIEAITSPDAQTATCEVQYGTSESYGSEIPCEEGLGTRGKRVFARAHVAGLGPGTTYYFEVVAENKTGKSLPSEGKGTFTTQPPSEMGGKENKEKPIEEKKEETKRLTPTETPIVATVTPVVIPATPIATTPSTGSVSLADTAITVQGGRTSLVKLECLGSASCLGKLTLTANIAPKVKGKNKPARTVTIGTVSFSIPGDETETVKLTIDTAGRALLKADHWRLSASLALLELAPGAANMQVRTVRLVEQKAHGRAGKE
jgi:hypothetical protein